MSYEWKDEVSCSSMNPSAYEIIKENANKFTKVEISFLYRIAAFYARADKVEEIINCVKNFPLNKREAYLAFMHELGEEIENEDIEKLIKKMEEITKGERDEKTIYNKLVNELL